MHEWVWTENEIIKTDLMASPQRSVGRSAVQFESLIDSARPHTLIRGEMTLLYGDQSVDQISRLSSLLLRLICTITSVDIEKLIR